ncbi:hypothetical protein PISMIDRAFT_477818 [Pisolithus microcarpus 441]|uniref:Uncharacterized protein n=1 Tax=Pisolithus microcarpus 441 TaxID=765257 RepID=A0A0C9YDL3_9AGAM|nr:hypothetical protein PISMIDRAFT_477818 [Pisolithus microcarpus 441]
MGAATCPKPGGKLTASHVGNVSECTEQLERSDEESDSDLSCRKGVGARRRRTGDGDSNPVRVQDESIPSEPRLPQLGLHDNWCVSTKGSGESTPSATEIFNG